MKISLPAFPVLLGLAWVLGLVSSPLALAQPRVPTQANEVLERLPLRPGDSTSRELAQLRAQVRQSAPKSPGQVDAAVRLAQRYFDMAMAKGDPRYVGYADALVKPFDQSDSAPLWALRGQLLQYRHGFEGALQAFARALQAEPTYASAHAWRGAIFLVQADYAQADAECRALETLGRMALAGACTGLRSAYTGHLDTALAHFQRALGATSDPSNRLWLLTRIAEVEAWRGRSVQAEAAYRQALALDLEDGYLLAAWSDFLLDEKRPAEVVQHLSSWESSDGLLLRLALAEKALGMPKAAAHAQALQDRFAAAKLRGDTTHRAEEARFLLHIKNQVALALPVAAANYAVQREPRDARILLEAALAANDPVTAKPALEWLHTSGFEDRRLRQLAQSLVPAVAKGQP